MKRYLTILITGLAIFSSCKSPSIIAIQSIQDGDYHANARAYDKAFHAYTNYLTVAPQLGVHRNLSMEGEVHRKLAYLSMARGKYDSALFFLNRAFAIDQKIPDNDVALIEDLHSLALLNAYNGDYREALRHLELVEKDFNLNLTKDINKKAYADLLLSRARINYTLGDYSETSEYLQRCLSMYERLTGAETEKAEVLYLMGRVAADRGLFDESAKLLTESVEVSKLQEINFARQLHALGDLDFFTGNLEQGIQKHLNGLHNAEESNILPLIIQSYLKVGDAYDFIGDDKSSGAYYRKALDLQKAQSLNLKGFEGSFELRLGSADKAREHFQRAGQQAGAAEAAVDLGEMLIAAGRFDSAIWQLTEAERIYAEHNNQVGLANTNLALAEASLGIGNLSDAEKHLIRSASSPAIRHNSWKYWFIKSKTYKQRQLIDSAEYALTLAIEVIENLRSGFTIQELKSAFHGDKNEVYEELISLLIASGEEAKVERAFNLNERARSRSFLDMVGSKVITAKRPEDAQMLQAEQALRLKISKLSREINSGENTSLSQDLIAELSRSVRRYDSLKMLLAPISPAYSSMLNVAPLPLIEISSGLEKNELVVEYWVGRYQSYAWLISKEGSEFYPLPIGEAEVGELIKAYRNSVKFQVPSAGRFSKLLYGKLISPFEDQLSRYTQIIFVPHRAQNFLPFQALMDEDERYLVSKYAISYAPSASVLYYCRNREVKKEQNLLLMALAELEIDGYSSLPGSKREAAELRKIFMKAEVSTAEQSTETTFKDQCKAFNFIHLATHGVLNERNPMSSFLLLNGGEKDDGKLTVSEILELEMNSRLITLSACETALGELNRGNELVGLSRAFIYSGASSVIVSLWKVDDATTSGLMVEFYRQLSTGKTISASLAEAQRLLLSQAGTEAAQNPYFWAPFIVIGR